MARRVLAGGSAVVAAVVGAAVVMPSAQSQGGDLAVSRELVNEVRALRGVIERYAEGQIHTQTLTGLLDVQQRRLADVNSRLDALRRELDVRTVKLHEVTRELERVEQQVDSAGPANPPGLDRRRMQEAERMHARQQFESESTLVQQLRSRESELLNQLSVEEGTWNDLVGRLDQWLKR